MLQIPMLKLRLSARPMDFRRCLTTGDRGFESRINWCDVRQLRKHLFAQAEKRLGKKLVTENMEILELQTMFAKYEERKRIVAGITNIFADTEYENLISQIVDVVIASEKPRILYLSSLKSFGKKNGTEVYRKIKDAETGVVG